MMVAEYHGVNRMQKWPGEVVATLRVDVAIRRPHAVRPECNRRRLLADDGHMPKVFLDVAVRALRSRTKRFIAV